jgi:hypothetical protein
MSVSEAVIFRTGFSYAYSTNSGVLGVIAMADTNIFYLIEESLGKQWYFSLTDQQLIEYTWREENSWTKPLQLDGQPIKQFRAAIDKNDRIHLLAYSTSKKLIYYEWNGEQWYQRLLYRVQSRFEDISHLELLSTFNRIHIFYYIENSLKRAQESLIHSWFENGKWKSNVLLNFLTDQGVKFQLVQYDTKGNLFVIYTRLLRNETRCYFIYYDNDLDSWSKPFILFQQLGKCSNFSGMGDSNGDFHIIWVEMTGPEYRLNYKKVIPNSLNSNTETHCILDNGAVPIDSTCLQITGNSIYCYWIQEGNAFVSQGHISGINWGQSNVIAQGPFHVYKKISKTLDGNSLVETKIGDGYPEFSWTLSTLLSNEQSNENKPAIIDDTNLLKVKSSDNSGLLSEQEMPDQNEQTLTQSVKEIQKLINKLQSEIKEIKNRMDDLHAALYQQQDYIRQNDKNSFQREAQIRKLAFEVEQIRAMRANMPIINLEKNEENNETSIQQPVLNDDKNNDDSLQNKMLPKNVDLGSGEIQLGNVSILINPEEESENDI